MASKRQKQLETQPETQNTVTISKKKKKAGNSGSGELSPSYTDDDNDTVREMDEIDQVIKSDGIVFSYDATIEKYKVVAFYKSKTHRVFKIVTVDGKSNSWRNVTALSDPRINDDKKAVFANGCLNWLTHDRYGCGGSKADKGKILSLDVSKEKFYAIDYPKGVSDKCKLMEMGGSLCFLDYEDEEKESKRTPRNEWLEFSVDIMQNNNVPELFKDFENSSCFALVKDPTLKIIFWTTIERVFDVPNERGHISSYDPEIYSYDVELKTFSLICEHGGRIYVKWDLNSLLLFQSTIAVQTSTELLLCNS
ncbi:hypothetical protein MKW94_009390 [Papaver nudicaule]|uniref:F-box associated beta-propeller type 3 domain-containing protein n=1 Tax=Papaver nudicaule TaxID=74823 RepID=A0AA41VJR6_PAPNU|nr:hypothetical protein [Papaver nudicaule]